jgi:hypothetical protein
MTNDRSNGILAFNIKNPYKITVDGDFEERTEIICHEMNCDKSCGVAATLDQMITVALTNISINSQAKKTKKQIAEEAEEENKDKIFYEENSPSVADVRKRSDMLWNGVKAQLAVKIPDLLEVFEELVGYKLICSAGDVPIFKPVWKTIKYDDKVDIMFRYIAFFANPLKSLQLMGTTDDEGKK